MNDELVWDNGTPFPEPCIDRIADTVGKAIIFFHEKFESLSLRIIAYPFVLCKYIYAVLNAYVVI